MDLPRTESPKDVFPRAPRHTILEGDGMARRRFQRIGYLHEQNGMWRLQYRVDKTDEHGKVTRKTIQKTIAYSKGPNAVSRREAGRIARENYLQKLDDFSIRPGSMLTVQQFVDQYYRKERIENLKPKGKEHVESFLKNHIIPAIGKLAIGDVSHSDIADMIYRIRNIRKLSSQTAIHARNIASGMFKLARAKNLFSGALPTEEQRIKLIAKERGALKWPEIEALMERLPEVVGDHPRNEGKVQVYRTLIRLMATTGVRVNEALALRWTSLSAGMITIDATVSKAATRYRDGNTLHTPKTSTSIRGIPIPKSMEAEIRALPRTSQFVFASLRGTPLDSHNILARVIKPAAKLAGLPEAVSWHWLRHSASTLLEQAGLTEAERQAVLGHSKAEQTRHYTHAEADRIREKMEIAGRKTE